MHYKKSLERNGKEMQPWLWWYKNMINFSALEENESRLSDKIGLWKQKKYQFCVNNISTETSEKLFLLVMCKYI
jgi:hypothetical protein